MPVFSFTLFFTKLIKSHIFSNEALLLLIKKLLCFSDIFASPKLILLSTFSLISSHTFFSNLFFGFLNVLPPVLTLNGCELSFFSFNLIIFSSIYFLSSFLVLKEALKKIRFFGKFICL